MKRLTLTSLILGSAMLLPVGELVAQRCAHKGPPQQKLLVSVFAGPKWATGSRNDQLPPRSELGVQIPDSIRQEIARVDCPRFFPIAVSDIENQLKQSSYAVDTALSLSDLKVLGGLMAADVILFGNVSYVNRNWQITPKLLDPYNEKIVQVLPTVTHARALFAARYAIETAKPAMMAMADIRKCRNLGRDQKYAEAIAAARSALTTFPASTMARLCIAFTYEAMKASPDSILSVTKEILEKDSLDYNAILISERAERARGNTKVANTLIAKALFINPLDVALQEEVINKLAQSDDFQGALDIVRKSKETNPGMPEIISLEATICFATKDYRCAIKAYEELAQVTPASDTTMINVQYFERLVRAYRDLNEPKEAAQAAARGIAKFPENLNLLKFHGQLLRESGDSVAAVAAFRKVLEKEQSAETYLQIAATFRKDQHDSVLATLAAGIPHAKTGADTALLLNLAIAGGQELINNADSLYRADSTLRTDALYAQFETGIKYMEFAESVKPADLPKFMMALSHFYISINYLTKGFAAQTTDKATACTMATDSYSRMTKTEDLINNGGGRVSPAGAAAILGAIQANRQNASDLKTSACKPGAG